MSDNGYFSFPNVMIDKLLCLLSGAEYKMLSVIFRQTMGWHKQWDRISITQFQKKCGLSKPGVRDSLKVLIKNNLILCHKVNEDGKLPESWYALYGSTNETTKLVRSPDRYDELTGKAILLDWVNSVDQLGEKLVRSPYPQKKGFKDTKKTNKAKPDSLPDPDPQAEQQSTIDDSYGIITEHTADDWIEYLIHIMKKPEQKYAPIAVQEIAQWLVSNNDLELIEQCYDEFCKVPLKKVFNRTGFFLKIISDVGGNTNFRQ